MKKILLLFTLISMSSAAYTQQLSLKECVDLAIKNHPDYQESILNAEMAKAGLSAAKSDLLPSMNVQVYQSTNTGRSIDRFTNSYINQVYNSTYAQAGISQTIFQGFRIKNNIEAKEMGLTATTHQLDAMKNNLTIRIIQAYLQVLQAQELASLAEVQVATSQEQLDRIESQVNAGVLAKKELLQIKTQVANDEFKVITAKGNEKQARLALFQLLNAAPDDNFLFEKIDTSPTFRAYESNDLDLLSDNLPELKAADAQIGSFDSKMKAIKAENLPSLNFSANYNTFFASSNPDEGFFEQLNGTRNASFTLGLQIPIFGSFQTKPRLQSALVEKRLAQNQLRSTKLQIQQGYSLALQNHQIAADQYKNAQRQLEINEENLAAVQAQIDAGTVNTLEYIVARTNRDLAQSNLVQAKYAFALQEKIIRFYQSSEWNL